MSDIIKGLVLAIVSIMTILPGIIKMARNSDDRESDDRESKEFSAGIAQIVIGSVLDGFVLVAWQYINFGPAA